MINQLGENGAAGKHAPLSEWEANEVRRESKPSAEVHIEKSRNRIYTIDSTLVIGCLESDSRTAVGQRVSYTEMRCSKQKMISVPMHRMAIMRDDLSSGRPVNYRVGLFVWVPE